MHMKMGYKVTTLFIALVLITGIMGGCKTRKEAEEGNSSDLQTGSGASNLNVTGFPIMRDKISLTGVGSRGVNHGDWNGMLFFEEYEKMTNIHIKWDAIPQASYAEKRNLLIASGDLPDLFLRAAFSLTDELNYGTQGAIVPLNNLIKNYAPNFSGIVEKNPEVIKYIKHADGTIYTLPQLNQLLEARTAKTWINKKWLDNLGLKMPETTDELYNVLKAFKNNDPNRNGKKDEIPFSGAFKNAQSGNFINLFLGYWGFGKTTGMVGKSIDVDDNGKVRLIAADSKYKEVLQYLNRLWSEGLIDRDFFTLDTKQFLAKSDEGLIGFAPGGNNNLWLGTKHMDDFVGTPVFRGPYGDHVLNFASPFVHATSTFAITSKNKYPEATMRWVDYFYSKEGTILIRMGIEGKTYKKLPNGDLVYVEEISNNPDGLTPDQAIGKYTIWTGGGIPQLITRETDLSGNTSPAAVAATELTRNDISKENVSTMFTLQEQSELNSLDSDLLQYIGEMRIKFITGVEPFTAWDQYIERMKQMGSDKYVKIYEDAYKRWKETK